MKLLKLIGLLCAFLPTTASAEANLATFKYIEHEKYQITEQQKNHIEKTAKQTILDFENLLSELKRPMNFTVRLIDRNLKDVHGVSGRADKDDAVEIFISATYQGGIDAAINEGLRGTIFHELHHTLRGWTIYDNKFPAGIDVATINEGLADVFAELQIGREMNKMSKTEDFNSWAKEILALPKNANYGQWMFDHPDGREAIGYRTGAYIVKLAMKNSGQNIVALSKLPIKEIYDLAGFKYGSNKL